LYAAFLISMIVGEVYAYGTLAEAYTYASAVRASIVAWARISAK
jgi:hypothetical protein